MKALRIFAAPLLAGLFAGCASTSPPHFPLGLYDVPPGDFPVVAAAGFNTVVGPASPASLDAAALQGLKVVASVPITDRASIRAMDRHHALWAWYLFDEPDMHLVSPQKVSRLNTERHALGRKPTFLVLMSGAAVEKYRDSGDLLAVDWYPVPWAPVGTVAREMRLARLALRGRPFYAILQAFDWSSFPELLRTDDALRPPTRDETRCMAYLALMQGASGLLFYTYHTEKWQLRQHPALWEALAQLAREVRDNAAIFADRVEWWPVRTETHGPAADMYNEIAEARVLLTLFHVKRPSGKTLPGYYLVAANTSGLPADFSFDLPFEQIEQFGTEAVQEPFLVNGMTVRKTYAPFEVSIFGPITGQLSP